MADMPIKEEKIEINDTNFIRIQSALLIEISDTMKKILKQLIETNYYIVCQSENKKPNDKKLKELLAKSK